MGDSAKVKGHATRCHVSMDEPTQASANGYARSRIPASISARSQASGHHWRGPTQPLTMATHQAPDDVPRSSRLHLAQVRPSQTGVNMGTAGPPSLGLNTTRTLSPMRTESRSQSTMLVIMVTPSSRVTYAMA